MTFGIFGYRRVTKVLRREGMVVNRKKVRRLMDIMGIKAIFPSPTTSVKNAGHNLLEDLKIDRPNQVW